MSAIGGGQTEEPDPTGTPAARIEAGAAKRLGLMIGAATHMPILRTHPKPARPPNQDVACQQGNALG